MLWLRDRLYGSRRKNGHHAALGGFKVAMALPEFRREPLVMGGRVNGERRGWQSCSRMPPCALSAAHGALGEEFFDKAGLAGTEFLIAAPDRRSNPRIADLAFVLQLVGGKFPNDRDHAASGFHFELLPPPVTLRLGSRSSAVLASLDTGASHCLFARAHTETLGLQVETGEHLTFSTANSRFERSATK